MKQVADPFQAHAMSASDVLTSLTADPVNGLSDKAAASRLAEYGPNELAERPRPGFLSRLIAQFRNFLVLILVVAAILALLLGEVIDAVAISVILALNAILGVVQESNAEKSLDALKKMAAPNAKVVRDGRQSAVPASAVVPGDIVLIEAGDHLPADLRLIEAVNLQVNESSLTGESVSSNKEAEAVLAADAPLGDRRNAAYRGTIVTYGRGRGVVVGTGMDTEIGKIADLIQSYEEEATPLQVRLDELGRWLGAISLAICALVLAIGIARDTEPGLALSDGIGGYLALYQGRLVELFMTSVSLAIAAVPEGLPAVVTICLALGMQRMVRRNALIRQLPAVETLGCATVICSDKTGTLTQNEMTVRRGWVGDGFFDVSGEGYSPDGEFSREGRPLDPADDPELALCLRGALLCNDARLERADDDWRIVGDPTEAALVVVAAKAGLWRDEESARSPRVAEVPFDSGRKRMTTVHGGGVPVATGSVLTEGVAEPAGGAVDYAPSDAETSLIAYTKGAPDLVLERCIGIASGGGVLPMTAERREAALAATREMARGALRVLGVAYRLHAEVPATGEPDHVERDLVFVGLLGMIDPPRPEAKAAVATARGAGLRTVMVTGDHRDTAEAIARDIGILESGGLVMTGAELDDVADADLPAMAGRVGVFARVSPEDKVRIVEAFKARGDVVAMTGDGVNDAPSLKRANIGVAMGITGTDVAKSTADMVLTDDNFASIVSAIEEGRTIYANIRKFVFYLVSCNVCEILIVFLAMVGGMPIPLKPVQLLWLNLVTDGAPALALGMEKGEPDVMRRPPRPPREPVIDREMQINTAVQAVVKTASVLAAFVLGLAWFPGHLEAAQTMAFITLVGSELLRAYTSRSERHSFLAGGVFSNRWLVWATVASLVLLLLVVYVPFLQPFFGTVPLGSREWLVMVPLMFTSPISAELAKVALNRFRPPALAPTA